ncbi:MAG: GtrA family protein [Candidatus Marinimicrobia bacterium]|nr:GtrA family protein [Candidatus Neomarinimicrobiota bacterium]
MAVALPKRFIIFTFVGVSGIVVNSGILFLLKEYLHLPLSFASLLAIQVAILNNFVWNMRFTWADREMKGFEAVRAGLLRFTLVSWVAGALNWIILLLLNHFTGLYYLLANLIAIFIASVLNYLLNDYWTFKSE